MSKFMEVYESSIDEVALEQEIETSLLQFSSMLVTEALEDDESGLINKNDNILVKIIKKGVILLLRLIHKVFLFSLRSIAQRRETGFLERYHRGGYLAT